MQDADCERKPDAATMRCLHSFAIRRYRLRCILFLAAPLIILIVIRASIFIHRKESGSPAWQQHRHPDADVEVDEISMQENMGKFEHVGLGGHFQPPPGDWRKWKESKNSGVKIETWTAVKRSNKAAMPEHVWARPGEQMLMDDVPEAFLPVVMPSTTIVANRKPEALQRKHAWPFQEPGEGKLPQQNEIIGLRRREDGEIVGKVREEHRGSTLEIGQGHHESTGQSEQNLLRKSDMRKMVMRSDSGDTATTHDRLGGNMQQQINGSTFQHGQGRFFKKGDGAMPGRDGHSLIGHATQIITRPKLKTAAKQIHEPVDKLDDGLDTNSEHDYLVKNDNVLDLNVDEMRAMRRRHTPPPWTHTIKPLQYEDYAKNCSHGSLPLPGTSFHIKKFCLVDDVREHFGMIRNRVCYHKGTDVEKTKRLTGDSQECYCKLSWHGKFCSMHDIIFKGGYPYEYGVGIQKPPRRLIYAFPFNAEFEMLDIILNSLSEAVDVFLILESNYTAAGQPKERVLLQRLQDGYFKEFQHKIVYISLDYFPRVAFTDGWAADALLRNHIGEIAFGGILENVRDDDIIISLDSDEIIRPEAVMFLKLHYGYPEPFGFSLQHTVYGYFWRAPDEVTNTYGGCRVAMFRSLLNSHLYDVRNAPKNIGRDTNKLQEFKRHYGSRIKPWLFGSRAFPAGWHCSWCFPPIGIRYKLISAHASDFPRWGTFPDKTNLKFIAKLVEKGLWFDEKTFLQSQMPGEENYAPPYVEAHVNRFARLRLHEIYMKNIQELGEAQQRKHKTASYVDNI